MWQNAVLVIKSLSKTFTLILDLSAGAMGLLVRKTAQYAF
jgi:hypothetical protein